MKTLPPIRAAISKNALSPSPQIPGPAVRHYVTDGLS